MKRKDKHSGSDREREFGNITKQPSDPDIEIHILSNGYDCGLNADCRTSRELGISEIGVR
jgi:hypothetical protein